MPAYHEYRRWAIESAALDLALRQAGMSLHGVAGARAAPAALRRLPADRRLRAARCSIASRPTATSATRSTTRRSWSPELIAELAATGAVDVDRLQGRLQGHDRRRRHRSRGLRALRRGLPGRLARGSRPHRRGRPPRCSQPHRDRITWDAPIHKVADLERFGFAPKCCNCQAVALRRAGDAVRLLRPLRGGGHRALRRRAVRARPRPRADPAAGGDLPPRRAQRRGAGRAGTSADFPRTGLPVSPLDPAPAPIGFRRA